MEEFCPLEKTTIDEPILCVENLASAINLGTNSNMPLSVEKDFGNKFEEWLQYLNTFDSLTSKLAKTISTSSDNSNLNEDQNEHEEIELHGLQNTSALPFEEDAEHTFCNQSFSNISSLATLNHINSSSTKRPRVGTNQLGGTYSNGRPLPASLRTRIIGLAEQGVKPCQISRKLRVSHGCVSKILSKYRVTGSINPGCRFLFDNSAVDLIASFESTCIGVDESACLQGAASRFQIVFLEIRQRLLEDSICIKENVPSVSSINRIIRTRLHADVLTDRQDIMDNYYSSTLEHSFIVEELIESDDATSSFSSPAEIKTYISSKSL
uniref:Paired domain-containing protein n=1 Tax=Ditylenchus dipsaci TaxID=166011 RepID=A0A915DLI4_9BILA